MSKTIFRSSDTNSTPPGGPITTSALTLTGSSKGDTLIIQDDSGLVGGISLGTTNDVYMANPNNDGLPGFSNVLKVGRVETNEFKINSTSTGDMFAVGATGDVGRIPIGTNNQILAVGLTNNPEWNDLDNVIPPYLHLHKVDFDGDVTMNNVLTTINQGELRVINFGSVILASSLLSLTSGSSLNIDNGCNAQIYDLIVNNSLRVSNLTGVPYYNDGYLQVKNPTYAYFQGGYNVTSTPTDIWFFNFFYEVGKIYKVTLTFKAINQAFGDDTCWIDTQCNIGADTGFFNDTTDGQHYVTKTRIFVYPTGISQNIVSTFRASVRLKSGQSGPISAGLFDSTLIFESMN